jgi:hypothetical protein
VAGRPERRQLRPQGAVDGVRTTRHPSLAGEIVR